jgi:tRNA(Ile)-lysidine synthase TilS/MesJ
MLERDADGVLHIVALSGGHDSTALSILLKETEPRPYNYVCTPTGDELP